jgi:hypothetical protein
MGQSDEEPLVLARCLSLALPVGMYLVAPVDPILKITPRHGFCMPQRLIERNDGIEA